MNRRSLLLSLLNLFEWLSQKFVYLFHSLIPQTISGKSVKNKAKLSVIEGNSVVGNQLLKGTQLSDFSADNVIISFNNNVLNCSLAVDNVISRVSLTQTIVQGHKYLFCEDIKIGSTVPATTIRLTSQHDVFNSINLINNPTANTTYYIRQIITSLSSYTNDLLRVCYFEGTKTIGGSCDLSNIMLIDLTQMFPFDTPTTLDDPRVQNILQKGYIPYNLGEIKDSEIGEIESEPYNLFDGVLEIGAISNNGNNSANSQVLRSKNWIKVLPNTSYKFNIESSLRPNGVFIYGRTIENDSSTGRFLTAITTQSFTIPSDINYVRFSLPQGSTASVPSSNTIYIHNSIIDLGYKPYKATSKLSLLAPYKSSGVGSAHDTYELTKTEHIFTRNVWRVDLGSLSWREPNANGRTYVYGSTITPTPQQNPNNAIVLLSNKYTCASLDTPKSISWYNNNIFITDSDFIGKTSEETKALLNGAKCIYPLATPQIIRIPRKHLACVDMGSLNWYYDNESGHETMFSEVLNNIAKPSLSDVIANIYTNKYLSATWSNLYSHNGKNIIAIQGNGRIRIYADDMGTNPTTFKNAMAGVYLWYETENEVADVSEQLDIEAGGTLNGNWFSWVKNQLCVNGNFAETSTWQLYNLSDTTWSVSDNVASVVVNSMTSNYGQFYQNINITTNHKYLLCLDIKTSANQDVEWRLGQGSSTTISATSSWQKYVNIHTRTDNGRDFGLLLKNTITTPIIIDLKNVIYIDLTLAFGSGKEPTSVNDPRIQHILSLGYISTDTTGTSDSVECQTLPNVEMLIKCK